MKAIILAAGVGKRLKPVTDTLPKCLIDINGETLINRHLRLLKENGIEEVVMVVGHLKDIIKKKADKAGVNLKFIENPRYKNGSITSLYMARGEMDNPCLLMDADVYYDKRLLSKLINSSHENCFLIDTDCSRTGEEMLLGIKDNRVVTISRSPQGNMDFVGEGIGFVKLSPSSARCLSRLSARFIDSGRIDEEYEEAIQELLASEHFGYEKVNGLQWAEIDFKEDIEKAGKLDITE